MLVTIFISYTSMYIQVLNTHKVRRNLKDTFDYHPTRPIRPTRPTRPIKLAPSALVVGVSTGPRRDIVVAQSTHAFSKKHVYRVNLKNNPHNEFNKEHKKQKSDFLCKNLPYPQFTSKFSKKQKEKSHVQNRTFFIKQNLTSEIQ